MCNLLSFSCSSLFSLGFLLFVVSFSLSSLFVWFLLAILEAVFIVSSLFIHHLFSFLSFVCLLVFSNENFYVVSNQRKEEKKEPKKDQLIGKELKASFATRFFLWQSSGKKKNWFTLFLPGVFVGNKQKFLRVDMEFNYEEWEKPTTKKFGYVGRFSNSDSSRKMSLLQKKCVGVDRSSCWTAVCAALWWGKGLEGQFLKRGFCIRGPFENKL